MPTFRSFRGLMLLREPTVLPEGYAPVAVNVWLEQGDLRPVERPREVLTLVKSGVRSIYRFGQALNSESSYWFHWTADVDVAKAQVAGDTTERTMFTGDGVPKFTNATLGTAGGNLPSAARPLALPPPQTPPTLSAVAGTGLADDVQRDYVYVFYNEFGDVSAPSPVSTITCKLNQHVTLSGLETTTLNGVPTAGRRVFRSESGAYLYVADLPATGNSFVDDVATDALGEEIPSTEWDPPPDDLFGLLNLPNGQNAAFSGRDMYFSEPYRPYAWPEKYRLVFPFPVVGGAVIGQTVVVVTTGIPYLVTGRDPGGMDQRPASDQLPPGVSKRSIVSTGADVIYASNAGLCVVSTATAGLLTDKLFTPAQWETRYNPSSITAVWHNGAYIASYLDGTTRRGFVFWPSAQAFVDLPDFAATAFHRDTVSGKLFCAINDRVYVWRGSTGEYALEWGSPHITGELTEYTWLSALASRYPATVEVWADDTLRDTVTVDRYEPVRIGDPSRQGVCRSWRLRVTGSTELQQVTLAKSPAEAMRG